MREMFALKTQCVFTRTRNRTNVMCNEKRFRHSDSLQKHMRIHTKEKPYECDVCDEAFRQSGHLKIHMRIHTNERPYECDVCEKRFRHSSALKVHVRTQH